MPENHEPIISKPEKEKTEPAGSAHSCCAFTVMHDNGRGFRNMGG